MQVLHINHSDKVGGAAIAGYRLHEGLIDHGITSHMMVDKIQSKSSCKHKTPRIKYLEKLAFSISKPLGLSYVNNIGTFTIPKYEIFQSSDLLIFHNLHQGSFGYFNYLSIPFLTRQKPAIFVLHDMWSFTGHCAYSLDCNRWQGGCGKCPYPDAYPAVVRDNTHTEWLLKKWVYGLSNLTIVAPSRWLTQLAKKSILNKFPIYHIPYGLDINTYRPLDPRSCRQALGIPLDKKVIMFGAASLSDQRKGGDLLQKAIIRLPKSIKDNSILLTFGKDCQKLVSDLGMTSVNLGYLKDDLHKVTAYSAADLFVFPTRADNLPLVLQESMACGTPMVSFDVGGVPDLVRQELTGSLAPAEDVDSFAKSITQLLNNTETLSKMRKHCRDIAVNEFSNIKQTQHYLRVMKEVLPGIEINFKK